VNKTTSLNSTSSIAEVVNNTKLNQTASILVVNQTSNITSLTEEPVDNKTVSVLVVNTSEVNHTLAVNKTKPDANKTLMQNQT